MKLVETVIEENQAKQIMENDQTLILLVELKGGEPNGIEFLKISLNRIINLLKKIHWSKSFFQLYLEKSYILVTNKIDN